MHPAKTYVHEAGHAAPPIRRGGKKSDLSEALSIYDSYFKTLAVNIFDDIKSTSTSAYAVHAIATAVLALACMASMTDDVMNLNVKGYINALIDGSMNILYVLQVAWTYSAIFWRQKELRKILNDIENVVQFVLGDAATANVYGKIRSVSKLNMLIISVLSAIPLAILAYSMTRAGGALPIATIIYRLLHVLFILPHHHFFMTFMLFVCFLLSNCFVQLKSRHRLRVNTVDGLASQRKLAVYVEYHAILCEIVNDLNDVYGDCFALWNASGLVTFIFSFRQLELNRDHPNFSPELILNLIYPALYFCVHSIYVSSVNHQVIVSLKGLTTISKANQEASSDDHHNGKSFEETSNTILFYIHHILISPPSINGRGYFTVEKTMILGVAGTCMTYILTLYGIKF